MTAWMRFWDWLRWTTPWWIVGACLLGLLFLATWGTWKISRWWFRNHQKDHLPEIARVEIEHRDELIADLRARMYCMESEAKELASIVRGIMSLGAGATAIGNTAYTERPHLRRVR